MKSGAEGTLGAICSAQDVRRPARNSAEGEHAADAKPAQDAEQGRPARRPDGRTASAVIRNGMIRRDGPRRQGMFKNSSQTRLGGAEMMKAGNAERAPGAHCPGHQEKITKQAKRAHHHLDAFRLKGGRDEPSVQ